MLNRMVSFKNMFLSGCICITFESKKNMRLPIFQQKNKHCVRTKQEKFLLFPLFYRGTFYWFESVMIRKSFNGTNLQTIDVTRVKTKIK